MRLLRSGNPHLNSRPDSLNLPWAIHSMSDSFLIHHPRVIRIPHLGHFSR
jgi:hypothetical protein